MASWLTLPEARVLWRDAPADDTVLTAYLSAAKEAVIAYAPTLDPDLPNSIPESYRLAQVLQARNIWNSGKASPGGEMDGSGYGLTTFPLDWQVKQLLRPQRAMGAIV